MKTKKVSKFLFWTPRVLAILFILYLAIFSFDVIQPGLSIGQIIIGLFMHNIPSLILTIILIISRKYEIVGGIVFCLAGLLYIGTLVGQGIVNGFQRYMISRSLSIAGPAILVGILFFLNRSKKRK